MFSSSGSVIDPLPMRDSQPRAAAAASANGTMPHDMLDRVATCAAVTLGAPLGAVSLVEGDALVLAGMHGFDRRRTPRGGSLCDAVAREGTALIVTDAAADPRFCRHEFTSLGGVRAYAGAPIKTASGQVLGTVAAFAGEAGAFAPAALPDLEALAHMVELLLDRAGPVEVALPRNRRQGWIGVRTLDARRAGTAARAGLVVLSVARNSPAAQIGVRSADILFTIDDQVLRERADLVAALADREPGSSARLTFQRAGRWLERWVQIIPTPRS